MAETTNISKLIINYLTEDQYQTAKASGLINENELYVTDVQDSTTLDCFEELFTATEGQTLFTLTEGTYQVGESRLTICVNGAQQPSTAYTETSSSSFTFVSGLSAGDSVIARYFNSRITSNIVVQAHNHGNITNRGAVGSTPNLPIFTGTSGLLETKSIEDAQRLLGVAQPDMSAKADKKVPAAAGNLASLDATGNLADSGKKTTDFDASGAASGAVSTHNSAPDAHSSLFSARQKKAKKTVVTLSPGSWSNKSIVASVDGATASNIIIVAPDPSYQSVYLTSNIRATAQETNSVTFSCDTTPTDDVLVNVVVLEDT